MVARCPGRSVGWSVPKHRVRRLLPTGQTARTSVARAVLPAMTEKAPSNAVSDRPFLRHGSTWSVLRGPSPVSYTHLRAHETSAHL
eukprot:7741257-Alexandrium_andersonii.AAC.1